jgi:hypothetical protein
MDEYFIKYQEVPVGSEIEPITVNGFATEWICASGARKNDTILAAPPGF